ncbi:unnamed protein product, partial [Linum tenue]
ECYFWINCIYFEPKYGLARILNTKIYSVLTLLDDTCDNFATYEEVLALVEAIERLDARALEELPDRMKNIYRLTLSVYDEIDEEVGKTGSMFVVEYAKEEFEQERNHAPSGVECCMKQYGISNKEAVEFLWKEISDAWKIIIQEYCQKPTLLPTIFTDRILNYARSMNLFYDNENGDCYTNPRLLKEHLTSLFIDPVHL